MKKNQKKSFSLPTLQTMAVVLFIFVVVLDGLIIYAQSMIQRVPPKVQPPVVNQTPAVPEGWRVYRDNNYGFELAYPNDSGRLDINDINMASEGFNPSWTLVLNISRRNKEILRLGVNAKDSEGMIRNSINDSSNGVADEIKVGGQKGERFVISQPDGSTPYYILVKRGEWLYSFVGAGEQFDAILATVKFAK